MVSHSSFELWDVIERLSFSLRQRFLDVLRALWQSNVRCNPGILIVPRSLIVCDLICILPKIYRLFRTDFRVIYAVIASSIEIFHGYLLSTITTCIFTVGPLSALLPPVSFPVSPSA